jgi:hypothetical protein
MRWPKGMEPEHAAVHTRTEIRIPAEPARVWAWLCLAERWPEWYGNCSWLRFRSGDGPNLKLDTAFTWKTSGVRVRSTVIVFEPHREIGWNGTAFGLKSYHGWTINAAEGGCHVVTEETQHGQLTAMGRWYLRREIASGHQNWLGSLREVALTGNPY